MCCGKVYGGEKERNRFCLCLRMRMFRLNCGRFKYVGRNVKYSREWMIVGEEDVDEYLGRKDSFR